jgi:signal transduction histidine kinase
MNAADDLLARRADRERIVFAGYVFVLFFAPLFLGQLIVTFNIRLDDIFDAGVAAVSVWLDLALLSLIVIFTVSNVIAKRIGDRALWFHYPSVVVLFSAFGAAALVHMHFLGTFNSLQTILIVVANTGFFWFVRRRGVYVFFVVGNLCILGLLALEFFHVIPYAPFLRNGSQLAATFLDPRVIGMNGIVYFVITGAFFSTLYFYRSSLEKQNQDLRRLQNEADRANRAKSEFLAAMSHELRTPLNSILGFAQILTGRLAGELTEPQARYAAHIQSSGNHLLQLINDLLDTAKVEAGKMDVVRTDVRLTDLLADCLNAIGERAATNGITATMALPPELQPATVWADERKLRQILLNLLSNAVKFTPRGGRIELRAKATGGEFIFAVADTGTGVSDENKKRIFRAFEQAESNSARRIQGTGLGLPLARRLTELHGGRLWVESEGEGRGSTFFFTIPRQTPEPGAPGVETPR